MCPLFYLQHPHNETPFPKIPAIRTGDCVEPNPRRPELPAPKTWEGQDAELDDVTVGFPHDLSDAVEVLNAGLVLESVGTLMGSLIMPKGFEFGDVFHRPSWKTLDVLEHTETAIHAAVRTHNPQVDPPREGSDVT